MKVLFINSNSPDYVYDSLFHGLRSLLGNDCVDVPKMDAMYGPLNYDIKTKLGNNGFTLYGLLEDSVKLIGKRFFWQREVESYDLIVIADIWENWAVFWNLFKKYPHKQFVVLDGHDIPAVYPYNNMAYKIKKAPFSFLAPVQKVKYFKREIWGGMECYGAEKYLHPMFKHLFKVPNYIHPISMSIPEEKIVKLNPQQKEKEWVNYLVDQDLAQLLQTEAIAVGEKKHLFTEEADYYNDLKKSKFGPTTKREGWDCLRHYEYASQGVILCFKDLMHKHVKCAPFGLDATNVLEYSDAHSLLKKVRSITQEKYKELLDNTYKWVCNNTTRKTAVLLLERAMK